MPTTSKPSSTRGDLGYPPVFRVVVLCAVVVASWVGCSNSTTPGGDGPRDRCAGVKLDTYVSNLTKATQKQRFSIRLVEANPAPPALGNNRWTFQVLGKAGKPVDGAALKVTPTMPTHGHGTTPPLLVGEPANTAGTYVLPVMDLFMPGPWRSVVTVTAGGLRDDVEFWFCIGS